MNKEKYIQGNLVKKVLLFISVLLIPALGFSSLLYVKGNLKMVKCRGIIQEFLEVPNKTKNIKVQLFKFNSYGNGFNKQVISSYDPTSKPEPDETAIISDIYGNEIVEFTYKEPPASILLESNFSAYTEANLNYKHSESEFPLSPEEVSFEEDFLISTSLVNANYKSIKKKAISLTDGYDMQIEAVMSIFTWVANNIGYRPRSKYYSGYTTLQKKKGNKEGIINLLLSLLRANNIPARAVSGYSVPESFFINSEETDDTILVKYPKSAYLWLEVYFPDSDWKAFDPFTSFYFVPQNLIRKAVGPDTDYVKDKGISDNVTYHINQVSFFETGRIETDLEIYNIQKMNTQYLFFPYFRNGSSEFKEIANKHFKSKVASKVYSTSTSPIMRLNPLSMSFNSNQKERVDCEISSSYLYAQKIPFRSSAKVYSIDLPLFRFNNDPNGKIWISIQKDNNGKPGEEVYQSIPQLIEDIPLSEDFQWVSFYFKESQAPEIKKGNWWISIKHQTEEIILWNGIFGNPMEEKDDTRYTSRDKIDYKNIVYLDLCFRIDGDWK